MVEKTAAVNKIIPFSNVDGPGNRLAIFFQSCNLRCIYCHNPETINFCRSCGLCVPGCPTGALSLKEEDSSSGKVIFSPEKCVECDQCIRICPYESSPRVRVYTPAQLLEEVKEYRAFIRGITVSGGEPTLQEPFISELFRLVKPLGLTCFVDTNGYFDMDAPEMVELIQETDRFMVDIKAVKETERICGELPLYDPMKNLERLLELGKVYEARTVLMENYMDMEETVKAVAQLVAPYPEVHYKLIRVHPAGFREEEREQIRLHIPSKDTVYKLAELAEKAGVEQVDVIL